MLAYVFWHRPASDVDRGTYERELTRFHRSLARRPPSGFRGATAFRAPQLPWLAPAPGGSSEGYEDWYLLDSWGAVGVLEEAAVSRGHVTSHDRVARAMGAGTGSVYRLCEGRGALADVRASVWVSPSSGQSGLTMADLLEDGMDPDTTCMWRRCLALGPAPELCLLGADAEEMGERTGVASGRLPRGWVASLAAREPLTSAEG